MPAPSVNARNLHRKTADITLSLNGFPAASAFREQTRATVSRIAIRHREDATDARGNAA